MDFVCLSVVKVNTMAVWDIMGCERPSMGTTQYKQTKFSTKSCKKLVTTNFETRVMNKFGAQMNVNLRRHFLGTS